MDLQSVSYVNRASKEVVLSRAVDHEDQVCEEQRDRQHDVVEELLFGISMFVRKKNCGCCCP
jgi:hypothetical protein